MTRPPGLGAGSYTMATKLAATMYNYLMRQQGGKHGCHGPYCFRWTFLIVAALCTLATGMALLLWYRSRQAYQAVIKVS